MTKIDFIKNKLEVTTCPHLTSAETIRNIMRDVLIALIPACVAAFILFSWQALYVIALTTFFCVTIEWLFSKIFFGKNNISDLSAAVTGVLLAFNLPSNAPWWIMLIGSAVAIILAKLAFGGIGQNIFNPALVARVFLLISWPAIMTSWPIPETINSFKDIFNCFDAQTSATTCATPLALLKINGYKALCDTIPNIHWKLFLGYRGGCLGETSALALLIGAAYLFYKRQITWHIPISYILTVAIISFIFWRIDSSRYADPIIHIFSGGVIIGAFFMATDMVTTPITNMGMLIFGVGCGIITMMIRLLGAYPEGVSFSILIMNAFTPLIDRLIKPKRYGV